MKKVRYLVTTACSLALSTTSSSYANDELGADVEELLNTPLTEILSRQNITVTSVSKKAESLSDAAAAIYVITSEDIRRSGATSIPEALRLAPGMQVARIDSNKWAISARGLNAQLANKLLVLIDGRDVYTPLFSGVNWDVQDLVLEDIDRIEVIRGSGATLWGANAVNGVINIITKSAKATPATLLTATAGNLDKSVSTRTGGQIGKDFFYRVYAKGFKRGETEDLNGLDAGDEWEQGRVGFRGDWEYSSADDITIQGDLYKGNEDRRSILPALAPTLQIIRETEEDREGGNILGRWNHRIDDDSETSLQVYLDRVVRNNNTLDQNRTTFDVDFQHTWNLNQRNELVWGLGARHTKDNFDNSTFISFDPEDRSYDLFSGFIQNKYAVKPEELFVTIGSKFESNDFTGFEYQPSLRALWKAAEKHTFWGAVSRAVRTPSRAEDDIELIASLLPGSGGAAFASQRGIRTYDSEKLTSFELGYRVTPSENIFVDASFFLNDYSDARTLELGSLDLSTGVPVFPFIPNNLGDITTYGVELTADWRVTPDWQLISNYTFITIDTDVDATSTDVLLVGEETRTPKNQFSVRSEYDLIQNVELDTAVFYTDNLSGAGVDGYLRFDARLGWTPMKSLDISLVGQNLFDDLHQEFTNPVHGIASEIPRSYYVKVTALF